MWDNTTKAISEVQVGDRVRSRDPQTGQESAKTVTATIKRQAPAVVTVSLTDAKTNKAETLTCTPEHPLYVQGQGWVEAGSLGIGSSIVSRAGPALSVASVTWHRGQGAEKSAGPGGTASGGYTVYNLTVEDDHTYFVGTAGGGTWVHNSVCSLASRIGESPYTKRLADRLKGTPAQADVDDLTAKLAAGNRNPQLGTRALGEGFYELRGANLGRVIVKQTGENAYDIIGKFVGHARGDAENSAIIQRIIGGYVP